MSTKTHIGKNRVALRAIHGNLTVTPSSTTAWFKLPASSWAFRADDDRCGRLSSVAAAYAKLAGYELHLRVTSRSYPVSVWAADLAAADPAPPTPGDGKPAWSRARRRLYDTWCEHQNRMQSYLNEARLDTKEIYLGVELVRRPLGSGLLDALTRRAAGTNEEKRFASTRRRVTEIMTGTGLAARPATSHELEWLVHRSLAPHVPAPEYLESLLHTQPVADVAPYIGIDTPGLVPAEDMGAFTDWLTVDATSRSKTAAVTTERDGQHITRHVAVLALGTVDSELTIPPADPWLGYLENLPFPIEVSARLRVVSGADAVQGIDRKLKLAKNQQAHHTEHNLIPPRQLARQIEMATAVEDEVSAGAETSATRVHGTIHLGVGAPDADTTLDRARAVIDLYRQRQVRVQHLPAQAGHLRAFTPGQRAVSDAHLRRMPVTMWAAAGPTVTSTLGDGKGPYLGETTRSSRRAVFWDPHRAVITRQDPGLSPVVAKLGGGKSTLIGSTAYQGVLRGIPGTLLDPAPPPNNLAALTTMPELTEHAVHINLMNAPSGTLNPYALVPEPDPAAFTEWRSFEEATQQAASDRIMLGRDIIRMLLPPEMDRDHKDVIRAAARTVGGASSNCLDQVVDELDRSNDSRARDVAGAISDMAGLSMARLFFGRPDREFAASLGALLTVITMPGLALPPDNPDVEPSEEELLAIPLLHLASRFAARRAFEKSQSQPAILGLDEMHFLSRWGSGRTLFHRLAHDSRRNRLRIFASAKKPSELLNLDAASLISETFVGNIDDYDTAAEALRLLRVPTGVGYEQALASLSGSGQRTPREFVMRDADGTVDRLRIDLNHSPRLLDALDTSGEPKTRTNGVGSPTIRTETRGGQARAPGEAFARHAAGTQPATQQQEEEHEWWLQ